jgi:peptidoglycan/LPS O-acetylase OafA/YrhL
MSSARRLAGVDGLRGLAALGIVLLHTWMYTGARDPGHSVLLDAAIGELRLGVTYFFVLSGFLLARPWLRAALEGTSGPAFGVYALHRAARLLPAYWFALVGAFLVLDGTGHPREAAARELPAFALFAQNQFHATAGQLNPPTWSLSVEVGFYALLPLVGLVLVRLARRHGRAGVLIGSGVVMALGLAWTFAGAALGWPGTVMTSLPTYLPVFACGLVAAALMHGRSVGPRLAAVLLAGGLVVVVANAWWHSAGTGLVGHGLLDFPAAVGFAAVIVAVVARPWRMLDTAPFRALGTVSYGTYLWHMPVLYWLVTRDLFPESPVWAFLSVAAPAIALGALSWFAIERPVLAWRRRLRPAPRRESAGRERWSGASARP